MNDDIDPISRIALDFGCKLCGKKLEKFYFMQYYILPSRLVRKRHREKERCAVYCCSCYESSEELDFEINGSAAVVNKDIKIDLNIMRCFCCEKIIVYGTLHGLLTMFLMMHGSGIESRILAVFCDECSETSLIEL